uniref:Geranylgeranyl transferase type-2 subunit alpha n=1 Tax=Caenorhabditis tropicalis TaxID=1561998 RepID=A0A1I7UXH0_9PELO
MHFVKKVPTTEEEKAAKAKVQFKRSQQFLHARDRIVSKRDKGEFDDEMLSLTQAILEKNPDIYTFWNIRRTTIEQRIEANQKIQESDIGEEEKTKSAQKLESFLSGELYLSYECIKSNPKSYSAWYQRTWILERQTTPDFKKELEMCKQALMMDCRNFHCWDHCRIVAKMAKKTKQEELEFSNALIEHNPSNYSAWHYRSVALENIHYDKKTGSLKLDDSLIASELEKVMTVFYMDAEDQSAWTYTRWLLENGNGKEFLRPESATPVELITASFHGNNTTLVFSRAVTIPFLLTFVDTEDTSRWRAFSSTSPNPSSSRVWQYLSDSPLRVVISKDSDENVIWSNLETPFINKSRLETIYDIHEVPQPEYIRNLLENVQILVEDEKKDEKTKNKWPLYMKTLILMEYQPIRSHEEIISNLKLLAEDLDPKRAELYKSILSRQKLNHSIREQFERILGTDSDQLVVRYAELTSLEGVEFLAGLVGNADFQGNQLKEIHRIVLPNVHNLTISENPIERLQPSPSLSHLTFLAIAGTQISSIDAVMPCFQTIPSLDRLIFCETPLVEKTEELRKQLPGVRLIPHWL